MLHMIVIDFGPC